MEPSKPRPLAAYLKETAWGLLLINLIMVGVSVLMTPHLGARVAFGMFAGVGLFITLLLVLVLGVFYLLALWFERGEKW